MIWAVIVLAPVGIWYYRKLKNEYIRKKQEKFLIQFKEMIQTFSAALNTGYSIENAIKESRKELRLLYSQDELIIKEIDIMVRQLRVQLPVEQVIEEFADRVQLEDVESFAAVFVTAKRSGGDMMAIIRNTSDQIGDKIDMKREIDTVLTAKRYEFKVMSIIPFTIIAYMTLSFPEFMNCLYGNIAGIGVMTICLMIYVAAYYLGVKLIEIEV